MAIIKRSALILGVMIEDECLLRNNQSAHVVPKVANKLLKRVRDFHQVTASGSIA